MEVKQGSISSPRSFRVIRRYVKEARLNPRRKKKRERRKESKKRSHKLQLKGKPLIREGGESREKIRRQVEDETDVVVDHLTLQQGFYFGLRKKEESCRQLLAL